MAIINVELRMMIAERLANDNYREEIKEVKESLRLHQFAQYNLCAWRNLYRNIKEGK